MDNIRLAFKKAARGKHRYTQVREVEQDLDNKLLEIQRMLIEGTFRTSKYKIYEPKERTIYVLPSMRKLKGTTNKHSESVRCSIDGWMIHANTHNLRRVMYEGHTENA